MKFTTFCMGILMLLPAGGCSSKTPSPDGTTLSDSVAKDKESPPDSDESTGPFDDFHLPLVIVIQTPEVPPEIQGPSPPIPQESQ